MSASPTCDPISSTSIERVWVPVGSVDPWGTVDNLPATATVQLAFVPIGEEPAVGDWHGASWDAGGAWPDSTGKYYLATLLLGPGFVPLTEGWYEVWAQVTRGVEVAEVGPIARLRVV